MRLPPGFSATHVAEAVGHEERLRTIDVMTQQPGPRLTLREPAVTCKCLSNFPCLPQAPICGCRRMAGIFQYSSG